MSTLTPVQQQAIMSVEVEDSPDCGFVFVLVAGRREAGFRDRADAESYAAAKRAGPHMEGTSKTVREAAQELGLAGGEA